MNIFIRADASIEIGTGHIMRCLTLAEELREQGGNVYFITRELEGNINEIIKNKGFFLYNLPNQKDVNTETDSKQTAKVMRFFGKKVDWLIIDSYSIDIEWENSLRNYANKIMVIDDLANRKHNCDVILDQNLYSNMESRYDALVPKSCMKLLGPSYTLLRKEFLNNLNTTRHRNGETNNILVFFGGSDPTNETEKTLKALQKLEGKFSVDVVVGKTNPHKKKVKEITDSMKNATYHCQIDYMAELIMKADLAIGAGGSATWERLFLGLPTLTIIIAENQRKLTRLLADKGVVINLGDGEQITIEDIYAAIRKILDKPDILKEIEYKSQILMASFISKRINIAQFLLRG